MTPDKDVIAYCRIGERSSHSWFVLHELLGYKRVRNYDGSWTEYGSLIGVPIEKPAPVAAAAVATHLGRSSVPSPVPGRWLAGVARASDGGRHATLLGRRPQR